ncbi:MAG: elongation factor Ts [Anaerolineaceae bacterium]
MSTTIELIKALRQESGAGIQDCRLALEECNSDYHQALGLLHEKMTREAEKLSDRQATQGWLELYSHGSGRLAVVVEINTETDFAAESEAVRNLGHEIALQIAASNPVHVKDEEIPIEILNDLSERTLAEARAAGKPDKVAQLMVDGRMKKYRTQNVLLDQAYIKDEQVTISKLIGQVSARVGENIQVRRFIRWEIETADSR